LADIVNYFGDSRNSPAGEEDSLENLLERSEGALGEVMVKLNELSGRVLELEELQASIKKLVNNRLSEVIHE
jgi:hypothetical protein